MLDRYLAMKSSVLFSSTFLLLLFFQSQGISQSIAFYADVMVNADRPEHRVIASTQFSELMSQQLDEQSFTNAFEDLPWISIQYPQDSTFRTITWQVDEGEGRYNYHGYLQTSEGQLFAFAGKRGRSTLRSNDELSFSQWKGGLIYKILTIPGGMNKYHLLTYSVSDAFTKVKTLEPIRFENDKVILGRKGLYGDRPETGALTSRLTIQYSIDANASITFDEPSKRLIFDNLVVVEGRIPGQGPTFVPDGSYKAYELDSDGKWNYVDKLYSQWNEGPLDATRDRTSDRELFKKKKNRN